MTENVMNVQTEIVWIGVGAFILFVFALTLALQHRAKVPPGSKGRRDSDGETTVIAPDGYIDSFAHEIEEAGGGIPPIMLVFIPGILLWWLIYLILRWQ